MSPFPSLLYSDVEDDLRASVRSLLDQHCPWERVLARTDTSEGHDATLWRRLTDDLGLAGLAVPSRLGGADATWREACVVAEELGRAVAPVPFLTSAGLATALAYHLRVETLCAELMAGVVGAVLQPFGAPSEPVRVAVDGNRLSGRVELVAGALEADLLLVVADDAVWRIDAATVIRTEAISLDMTRRLADVVLDDVPGQPLAASGGRAALAAATDITAALLAAEQLGIAERCFEMTTQYVAVRRQFGRTVGSYQAVKHRLADLWTALTQARAVARYAAARAATGEADLAIAAALAQSVCSDVAQLAAQECVQLHGGIGFTWEHPAHLFLKRARADSLALGSPTWHRRRLAALVGLEPALPASITEENL
ncbi:acyl-CoA dehydrogenase family protein [Nocardia rhamnosiphila]|uniref:Acyl-CoA dehydrogenase family protein n=1 Tax=Nocardia rhamnosiphila TaxID=426716 RepID=A0ABV2WRC5_9NOCA